MCRDFIKATTLCVFPHIGCFFIFFFFLWKVFFLFLNLCFWSGFLIFCRIVVSLKEEVWYQKCHDPECRNFRSSSKFWTAYQGFIKSVQEQSSFLWKATRCPRRSALATSWHKLVHFASLSSFIFLFNPVCLCFSTSRLFTDRTRKTSLI